MTVNTGVKGTLAKLLATEDLIIEHKNCQTASFDVKRRVLSGTKQVRLYMTCSYLTR